MISNIAKLLFALVLSGLFSCRKIETEIEKDTPKYYGTMVVTYEGKEYVSDNVAVQAAVSKDGTSADVKLLKVKFVPSMPVRIDVTVPAIPVTGRGEDGTVEFAGTGIVPYALGGAYEKFTVTDLSGTMTGNQIRFSLNFGDYPTRYEGVLQ